MRPGTTIVLALLMAALLLYLEPLTFPLAIILVAHDGEWTRRRVPSVEWAHEFANRLGIPSYDAAVVGIPARMREHNRRRKESGLS